MVTSDFRPEVEIRPFRACTMKNTQYNPWSHNHSMAKLPKLLRHKEIWVENHDDVRFLSRKWKYGCFVHAQCIRRTVTSYLETELRLVYKRVHTADKTGQNCSVSNIFRTTENCPRLSRTHFTLHTRTRQYSLVLSCPRLRCELGIRPTDRHMYVGRP